LDVIAEALLEYRDGHRYGGRSRRRGVAGEGQAALHAAQRHGGTAMVRSAQLTRYRYLESAACRGRIERNAGLRIDRDVDAVGLDVAPRHPEQPGAQHTECCD